MTGYLVVGARCDHQDEANINHSEPHQAKVPLRTVLQIKLHDDLPQLRREKDTTASQNISDQAGPLSKQLCFGHRLCARDGHHKLEPIIRRHHGGQRTLNKTKKKEYEGNLDSPLYKQTRVLIGPL